MTAPNVLLTSPDPALSAAGDDGSSLPPEDSPLSFRARSGLSAPSSASVSLLRKLEPANFPYPFTQASNLSVFFMSDAGLVRGQPISASFTLSDGNARLLRNAVPPQLSADFSDSDLNPWTKLVIGTLPF